MNAAPKTITSQQKKQRDWNIVWAAVVVISFVFLTLLFGAYFAEMMTAPQRWLIIAILMVGFLLIVGYGITGGRLDGVFIDSRFKISLSRFQIIAWTVLVLSAYVTIALPRSLPGGLDGLTQNNKLDEEKMAQCLENLGAQDLEAAEEQVATAKENLALAEENLAAANESLETTQANLEAVRESVGEGEERAETGDEDVVAAKERVATAEENRATAEENLAAAEKDLTASEEAAEECVPQPLKIIFPPELIAALGISAASFAGSSLVKHVKRSQTIDTKKEDIEELRAELDEAKTNEEDARRKMASAKKRFDELVKTPAGGGKVTELETKVRELEAQLSSAAEEARPEVEKDLSQAKADLAKAKEIAAQAIERRNKEISDAQTTSNSATGKYIDAMERKGEIEKKLAKAKAGVKRTHENTDIKDASWADMFRGEEQGNQTTIDMAKVQQFFFTIVILFSYGAAIYGLLKTGDLRNPLGIDLPSFSTSLNALLGISHAGYLTVKLVPDVEEVSLKEMDGEKAPEETKTAS